MTLSGKLSALQPGDKVARLRGGSYLEPWQAPYEILTVERRTPTMIFTEGPNGKAQGYLVRNGRSHGGSKEYIDPITPEILEACRLGVKRTQIERAIYKCQQLWPKVWKKLDMTRAIKAAELVKELLELLEPPAPEEVPLAKR
jgi:hypothetical protein